MPRGDYLIGTLVYSDSFVGETRKKYFNSQFIKLASFFTSNMVLLIINFFSTILDTGDPASAL